MPALISIGLGLLWATIMVLTSRRRVANSFSKFVATLMIGILAWFAWILKAGELWSANGLVWAFLGTPVTVGVSLLLIQFAPLSLKNWYFQTPRPATEHIFDPKGSHRNP